MLPRMGEAKTQARIELTPQQLAGQLRVTPQTLGYWRAKKVGPPYYRLVHRIIYYQHEVDEWRDSSRWG